MTGWVPQMEQPHYEYSDVVNLAAGHPSRGSYMGNGRGGDGCSEYCLGAKL